MSKRLKKIDIVVLLAIILVATIFFYKAGYISPFEDRDTGGEEPSPPIDETPVNRTPQLPPSFILPSLRAITPDDEGCHYKSLLVSREWWYFTAVLYGEEREEWGVAISFKHLAYGDLFGELKPDVLTVVLYDNNGNVYGGLTNERRGTLKATSPGVDISFKDSWVQGSYPTWHVHVEDKDIDEKHEIIVDLDYQAHSLPLWTYDNRILNNSRSTLASYVVIGCTVKGKIIIDGRTYEVEGTGTYEHSWSPFYVRKSLFGGWDWFHIKLENGWMIYISQFYPSPKALTTKYNKFSPFGVMIITPDGDTITKFSTFNLNSKSQEKIFLFTRFPAEFTLSAKKSHNLLLERIDLKVDMDIKTKDTYQKVWKFPTYVGVKIGGCTATGSISWVENGESYDIEIRGVGIGWTTRILP